MNVIEKYKNVSYSNGKFLSDKSYAYDSIFFISKFFLEFCENGIINLKKYQIFLYDYISKVFNITNEDDIRNYINEVCHVFKYAKMIEEVEKDIYIILDMEILQFITRKIENAYIFIYVLSYFTIKNSGVLELYKDFCNITSITKKVEILKEINEILYELNPSTRSGADSQWAKQNTKYVINNLNFINYQPEVTRSLTINEDVIRNPATISVNVKGTKTIGKKNNSYLFNFDFEYVEKTLNDIIVYKGVK